MTTGVGLGRITQVALFVRDLDRAVAFYRDTLELPHLLTAGALAFFEVQGVRLYLHARDEDEWRPGSILYFLVDDIGATYRQLLARAVITAGPPHLVHTEESGTQEWMVFFEDSEGNTLAAVAHVAPGGGG